MKQRIGYAIMVVCAAILGIVLLISKEHGHKSTEEVLVALRAEKLTDGNVIGWITVCKTLDYLSVGSVGNGVAVDRSFPTSAGCDHSGVEPGIPPSPYREVASFYKKNTQRFNSCICISRRQACICCQEGNLIQIAPAMQF